MSTVASFQGAALNNTASRWRDYHALQTKFLSRSGSSCSSALPSVSHSTDSRRRFVSLGVEHIARREVADASIQRTTFRIQEMII